jgi:hypothetical protein
MLLNLYAASPLCVDAGILMPKLFHLYARMPTLRQLYATKLNLYASKPLCCSLNLYAWMPKLRHLYAAK